MSIYKVISGGQTGADRAALDAAIKVGVSHGGWVPKGRLAEDGAIPPNYSLKEMSTGSHAARTEQNVLDSDGTVIISHGDLTGGSKLTQDFSRKHEKPCLHIDIHKTPQFLAASEIHRWVIENGIETLNVAGPRASKDPEIYRDTKYIIEAAILLSVMSDDPRARIRDYSKEELLEKLPVLPRTVADAAEQLIEMMSVVDRNTIANLDSTDAILDVYDSLRKYIIETFHLPDNEELMASCREFPDELIVDESDAAAVIVGVMHYGLQQMNRLRTVD